MEEQQKELKIKDVIKVLLGNKFIYLIMAVCFMAVSIGALSFFSARKGEYVALFDYDVAGFSTTVDEAGNVNAQFIDGEKFDARSAITKEKVLKYFASSEELENLDAEELYTNNVIKSFGYTVKYVKNSHQKDEKDAAYIEEKRGYELVLNSKLLNEDQAKALTQAIANEVVEASKVKIDKIQYDAYLNYYDSTNSYPEKISSLTNGIAYLKDLSNSLIGEFGDVLLNEGNYGGDDAKYHLDSKTISSWQKQLDIVFDLYYVDSLAAEQEINGYISADAENYVESLKTVIANLKKQYEVDLIVLEDLKDQREKLFDSLGTDVTIESIEIGEYNGEIIALTKKMAEEDQLVKLYQAQLDKLDPTKFPSPEERDAYMANLAQFDSKLSAIRENLEFYTNQYEAIAKQTMKNDSLVYFDNPNIVKAQGTMDFVVTFAASLAIGLVAPMLVNLAITVFKIADGKPIFKLKKEETK